MRYLSKKDRVKKGNVFISMLFFLIMILIVTAIVFSHITSVESSQKAKKAAQIIAETRAMAIDIPLKERYGYVEILHEPYAYETPFPVPPIYENPGESITGYDQPILNPSHEDYRKAVAYADAAAKEAGIKFIDGVTGDNGNNTKLLSVNPENICVTVISLPDEVVAERELTCGPITKPGNSDTVVAEIKTKEISINGSQHSLNGFTSSTSTIQNSIQNYNFVLVVLSYQEQTFFYKTIQRFAHGSDESEWTDAPTRTVWAIAYPQTDFCTGEEC